MSGEGQADDPEVTVVVVNYNGGDYLRGCLASLAGTESTPTRPARKRATR